MIKLICITNILNLRDIQIIRDSLRGGGEGTEKCHQITQGRGLAKVYRDIFLKTLNHAFSKEKASILENQNVTSHRTTVTK